MLFAVYAFEQVRIDRFQIFRSLLQQQVTVRCAMELCTNTAPGFKLAVIGRVTELLAVGALRHTVFVDYVIGPFNLRATNKFGLLDGSKC